MNLIHYSLTCISEFDHKVEIQSSPELVTQLVRRIGGLSLLTWCSGQCVVLPFQKAGVGITGGLAGGCMAPVALKYPPGADPPPELFLVQV